VRSAVGEKPVKDESQDWEEEDDEAPEQLVRHRAVGLEDFHCKGRLALFDSSTKVCDL
jgi:hypothetical protein